jgi:hypothetical protein
MMLLLLLLGHNRKRTAEYSYSPFSFTMACSNLFTPAANKLDIVVSEEGEFFLSSE